MYQKRIITSKDGSHTIELIGQNEQYHSTFGAIQESRHVYIEHGLKRVATNKRQLNILEVGMGSGLNVLLTFQYALKHHLHIHYIAVEPYPLQKEIWAQLNYAEILQKDCPVVFEKIHQSSWNEELILNKNFVLKKINQPIQDIDLYHYSFDVVYFDAFNPDLEPELWSPEVFSKIYTSMNNNSVLSTYSTKGVVKRALKKCGFKIEKKPGPIGKREILNALKENQSLRTV